MRKVLKSRQPLNELSGKLVNKTEKQLMNLDLRMGKNPIPSKMTLKKRKRIGMRKVTTMTMTLLSQFKGENP